MPFGKIQILKAALAAMALAVVAACGGGGGGTAEPAAPASGATVETIQTLTGTITGFGSVIIDGQKFDDTRTTVAIDTNPAAPAAGTLSDLKLGMGIEAKLKDGQLTDVVVRAALRGPIGAIDLAAGTFTVLGQSVKVVTDGATPTVFEGAGGLPALAPADLVEVHGTLDANKVVQATRVERKPKAELSGGIRFGGIVSQLDAAAKTFRINDMTIDYSAATLLPDGAALADGKMVMLFADTPPVPGQAFKPKSVRLVKPDEGSEFGIGGRIMAFVSLADFTVSGVHIDGSAATFEGGTATDLAPGVIVGAEGKVEAGVLKARKLRILKTPVDVAASLKGQVTDYVSASSFKVRGAPVNASAASFVNGGASDLGNGAWVTVKGKIQGEVLKADSVEFQTAPVDKPVSLKGEVRDWNAQAGTFHFLGVDLKLGANVEFSGGTLANIVNGKRVEVTGTPGADKVVLVTKLVFLGDLAPQASVVGGRISDLTDTGFKLPGIAVTYNGNTQFDDGATARDLANGAMVLAKGTYNAQTQSVVATWIEIVKTDLNAVRLGGPVTDYVSASDFRAAGQKVDASQALFVDGTAADLGNGKVLEVVGALREVNGVRVVAATKVRFLLK